MIVSNSKSSAYLLQQVHIYTDHGNLAYIFNPEACGSSFTKTAQRLDHQWKVVLGQYDYAIVHIAGDRNCWGQLLSRLVTIPSVRVRAVIFAAVKGSRSLHLLKRERRCLVRSERLFMVPGLLPPHPLYLLLKILVVQYIFRPLLPSR